MSKVTSFLYVLAVVGYAPLAQAALQLSFQIPAIELSFQIPAIDPLVVLFCFTDPSDTGPDTWPAISVNGIVITQFHALTNSPGGPDNAQELGSVLTITDTAASTSIITLCPFCCQKP